MERNSQETDFRAGNVLAKSFSVWFRNLVPFTLLSALVYAPLIAYTAVVASGVVTRESIELWEAITGLGSAVLGLLVTGAVIYGVLEQLRGAPAGLGASLAVGARRLLPCLGAGLLTVMLITAPVVVGVLLDDGGSGALLMLPLAIFSIWLACVLYVVVPVTVIERQGVFAALGRSAELTRGARGSIFGVSLLIGLLGYSGDFVTRVAELQLHAALWVSIGTSIVIGALQAVTSAVVYHDLRTSKEGVGIEELVSVFA